MRTQWPEIVAGIENTFIPNERHMIVVGGSLFPVVPASDRLVVVRSGVFPAAQVVETMPLESKLYETFAFDNLAQTLFAVGFVLVLRLSPGVRFFDAGYSRAKPDGIEPLIYFGAGTIGFVQRLGVEQIQVGEANNGEVISHLIKRVRR